MRRFLRIIYNLLNPGMFAALLVLAGRYRGFSALWPQAPVWVDATLLIALCAWLALIYRGLFNRFAGRDRKAETETGAGAGAGAGAIFPSGTRFFQGALLLLGLLFLAGIGWSADPEYGLHKTAYFFIYVITWLALILHLKNRDMDILLKTMVVAALLLTAFAVAPLLPEIAAALAAGEAITWGRLAAIGGGPNVFSRFTSVGFLITFYYILKSSSWSKQLLLCPVLLVLGAATYLSGSRGSFLGLAGALFVYMILRLILRRRRRLVNVTVLVAAIMVLLILIFGLDVQDRYRPAWEAPQVQAGDRFYCAQRSLELGATSPWVGWGTGSFAYHVPEAEARYPHNIFLELYAENGVLGLALLALLLAGIVRIWLNALRLRPENAPPEREQVYLFAALFVFSLLVAQVSGDTVDSRWIWFSGFLIANLCLRIKEGKAAIAVESISDQT